MNSASWDDLRAVLRDTAEILDQPAVGQNLEIRTYQLARPLPDDEGESAGTARVLVFTLGTERYGWLVVNVSAITRVNRLTPVPSTPPYYSGVVSFRGRILSVMDLRVYLGLAPLPEIPELMVVIDGAGLQIGVLASDVFDVLTVPRTRLASASSAGLDAELINGITPDGLALLDAEALLRRERERVESEDPSK